MRRSERAEGLSNLSQVAWSNDTSFFYHLLPLPPATLLQTTHNTINKLDEAVREQHYIEIDSGRVRGSIFFCLPHPNLSCLEDGGLSCKNKQTRKGGSVSTGAHCCCYYKYHSTQTVQEGANLETSKEFKQRCNHISVQAYNHVHQQY